MSKIYKILDSYHFHLRTHVRHLKTVEAVKYLFHIITRDVVAIKRSNQLKNSIY